MDPARILFVDAVDAAIDLSRLRAERDRLAAELIRRNDELVRLNAQLDRSRSAAVPRIPDVGIGSGC